jgi:hypothetical protein
LAQVLVPESGSAPVDRGCRPTTVAAAAKALWLRAALRLPLFAFAVFYLAHGVELGQRSPRFPDGAAFMWLLYHLPEIDTVAWMAGGYLMELFRADYSGPAWMVVWLIAYAALSAGYAVVGLLVWRGSRLLRRHYQGCVAYLMLEAGLRVVSLVVVVPGALSALGSGENAGRDDYFGKPVVHLYEGFLLPWVLTLSVATVAVVVLLRTDSARHYLRNGADPAA